MSGHRIIQELKPYKKFSWVELKAFTRDVDGFAPAAMSAVEEALDSSKAWATNLVGIPEWEYLKMDSTLNVAQLHQFLTGAIQEVPADGEMVVLFSNVEHRGLDRIEALAVFGRYFFVKHEFMHQSSEKLTKHILVCQQRKNTIGSLATLAGVEGREGVGKALRLMTHSPNKPTFLALRRDEAIAWGLTETTSAERVCLEKMIASKEMGLCLHVPKSETNEALGDLRGYMGSLAAKVGGVSLVRAIRFEDEKRMAFEHDMRSVMEKAGIAVDFTFAPSHGRDINAKCDTSVVGSYLESGAYYSQIHDNRIPGALAAPPVHLEVVRRLFPRLTENGDDRLASATEKRWGALWDDLIGYDYDRFRETLNFPRIEKYHVDIEYYRDPLRGNHPSVSLNLMQNYEKYILYNERSQHPQCHVTLYDVGSVAVNAGHAAVEKISDMAKSLHRQVSLVGCENFIVAAQQEAEMRVESSPKEIFWSQVRAHKYLSSDVNNQLRQDVVDFLADVPKGDGRALEIGCGVGRLAKELIGKGWSYAGVDLHVPAPPEDGDGNISFIQADTHALPFGNDTFDLVIANNILEHLYHPSLALRELKRCMKDGGVLHTLIPLDALNPMHELPTHLWKADMDSIHQVCKMEGLVVEDFRIIDLYAMGVEGSFPTCKGMVGKVIVSKPRR